MKNKALHPKQWPEFCSAFTQLNKGTLMTVELVQLDGRRDDVVRDGLFQKMTFDTGDACNNMLSLFFGMEGERRIHHIVVEPIHIRLKETNGHQKLLQIEAENGVTLVSFHSGRVPELRFESEFKDLNRSRKRQQQRAIPS